MDTQSFYLAFLSAFIYYVVLTVGQEELYCNRVQGVDCSTLEQHFVCGTDNVTYTNMCFFAKAHCADKNIHHSHEGQCGLDGPNATRSPEEVTHISEVAFDYECIYLSHITCTPATDEVVCGTDGYTYPNFCEYAKGRCTHRNLHVAHFGNCTVT